VQPAIDDIGEPELAYQQVNGADTAVADAAAAVADSYWMLLAVSMGLARNGAGLFWPVVSEFAACDERASCVLWRSLEIPP